MGEGAETVVISPHCRVITGLGSFHGAPCSLPCWELCGAGRGGQEWQVGRWAGREAGKQWWVGWWGGRTQWWAGEWWVGRWEVAVGVGSGGGSWEEMAAVVGGYVGGEVGKRQGK